MFTIKSLSAALVISVASVTSANAQVFNWTSNIPLTTGGYITGSGQLTAQDTVSASFHPGYYGYLVTSISGTYGGATITGLMSGGMMSWWGNDNLVNTSNGLYLNLHGIAFSINGTVPGYNTDHGIRLGYANGYRDNGPTFPSETGFTLAPVPEPEEWAMMLVGFGLVGWQAKRKQKLAA
jgi:hypothetical protein